MVFQRINYPRNSGNWTKSQNQQSIQMEKNTDGSSEPTTETSLTPSFQNKLDQKARLFDPRTNSFTSSNIFHRFYKVPMVLSVIVGVLFSALFVEVLYLFLPHNWVGFGVMIAFAFIMWGYIRPIINGLCLTMLVRRRIWEWGRYKFDSWKDITAWMIMTDLFDLDDIVGYESDWEPDIENGGTVKA